MTIGDRPFSIFEIDDLVASSKHIGLSAAAVSRIARARTIVEAYAAGNEPVYGLNTGLGGNIAFRIEPEAIQAFQNQLVIGRNIGVGDPLTERVCRAVLLSRIVGLASGGSGMSPATVRLLVDMFNAGVTPVIPARGSISAADLGLSAHIGAVAIGRGEAWFSGERMGGAQALAHAGLAPARLEPKDGLALCNHSAPSAGHAAVTLVEAAHAAMGACAIAAMSVEAYGANTGIFDARLNAARPAAGQVDAAALFRVLLQGGRQPAGAARVQDPLSFRCIAPIFGSLFAAFANARREVEVEINGATDNPVVLIEDALMLSTPNFHTPSIALACDTLCIALTQVAAASAQRIIKLMNPVLSGLPKYLSPVGGASAGLVPLQKTTVALFAEIRLSATPASLDAMPVSDTVEDHAPLTLLAVRKLAGQLVPFNLLVAIEALVAAQAVDLREGATWSDACKGLHTVIRSHVPKLDHDREPGPDVMSVHGILASQEVRRAIRLSAGDLSLPILWREVPYAG